MARLQRKKPAIKKKRRQDFDGDGIAIQKDEADNNKLSLLGGISRDTKSKLAPTRLIKKSQGDRFFDKWLQFLREVKIELKKVTWPSRNQTMGSTAVVILLVMIISLFLGLVDYGLGNLVRVVLH